MNSIDAIHLNVQRASNSFSFVFPNSQGLGQLWTTLLGPRLSFEFGADWRGREKAQLETASYFFGVTFGDAKERESPGSCHPVF